MADTAFIANRLPWEGAVILGVVLFVVFYWLLPAWINYQLSSLHSNTLRPIIEAIFARRIHWLQWLGIALAIICAIFALFNLISTERLSRSGERNISFVSRLLARWID